MSLQFNPNLGRENENNQEKQQQFNNMLQAISTLGQGIHSYQNNKRQGIQDAMALDEKKQKDTLFNQQQAEYLRQNTPQGNNPGWQGPTEGADLTMGAGQSTPEVTNKLSLFSPQAQAPQMPQEGPQTDQGRGVLDHWDKSFPHLSSGKPGADMSFQGAPDYLSNAYNDPTKTPKQVADLEGRYSKNVGFEKEQSEIAKNNATANQQYVIPQFDQNGQVTGYTPLPTGAKPAPFMKPENTLALSEKSDQFYQKEWDKIDKEANPLTTSGRTGLGMAARADYNANRALVTLNKSMVTNQEAANVMADIAQIYQGGSATQYGMSHQGYDSLYQKLKGVQQYITGKPEDSVPTEIKSRLIGVLNEMKQTNKAVFKQQLDHIERAQPKVISKFSNEWKSVRENLENGIAGGPTTPPPGGFDEAKQARLAELRRKRDNGTLGK